MRTRSTVASLTCVAAMAPVLATAPPALAAKPVRPTASAQLLFPLNALRSPSESSRHVRYLEDSSPERGQPMRLPIVEAREVRSRDWFRVLLPGRPLNRTGWIPASAARKVPLTWRLRVDVGNRTLAVFQKGRLRRRLHVVVGKPSTPTPRGRFFVIEKVRLEQPWGLGGWALALSAYSNVLRRFDGGPGQVAIHSRGSLFGPLGSASSHGCVRVASGAATWLARHVPVGAYVEIVS